MNINRSATGLPKWPTLGPGADPAARLTMEDLEKLFADLTSDTCAEVAWQFACSNLPDALGPLLERVPLRVDFATLCIALAEALNEAQAAHAPAHCAVLLELAGTDNRLSLQEALDLLHACSRYMAGQHVTDPLLWRKLLEAIRDDIAPDLRACACARLAKAMEEAGVDDQVSSNMLVRRAMPLSQKASREHFTSMAGGLSWAGVTCPRVWAAMQGYLRRCKFCDAASQSVLLQAVFSLPMRPRELPILIDAIGLAKFLEGFERTFDKDVQHPAWGLLAEVVHECGNNDLWLTHMAEMTKSGQVAAILLGELNRQARPELLSAPAMCKGIFRLGRLALQRYGSFPKDFEELAAKVLGRLPDGGVVAWCLKELESLALPLRAWTAFADCWISTRAPKRSMDELLKLIKPGLGAHSNEQKFLLLRELHVKLDEAYLEAESGSNPVGGVWLKRGPDRHWQVSHDSDEASATEIKADTLKDICRLFYTVSCDEKCRELQPAMAKRVCDVLVTQPDTMVSFFSGDGWPFRRSVLEQLAPNHWKVVQTSAKGLGLAKKLQEDAPEILQRAIVPKSVQWLPAIMDHHRSRVLHGEYTPRFDFEMIRLLLACAASTPGDDVHKTEAIRYLKAPFLALPPERQEELRSQPDAGPLIDQVLSTP